MATCAGPVKALPDPTHAAEPGCPDMDRIQLACIELSATIGTAVTRSGSNIFQRF